jgi:hypothetical protein
MSKDRSVSPELLEQHLSRLTREIGVRLAGSEGERLAAEYIAGEFAGYGAAVSLEEYEIQSRVVEKQHLLINIGGRWRSFPALSLATLPVLTAGCWKHRWSFLKVPAVAVFLIFPIYGGGR